MDTKSVLHIALASCLLIGLAHADALAVLPSRQPSVIMPRLARFSPNDTSEESIMRQLGNLLGKFDNYDSGGHGGFCSWKFYSYGLDDNTQIIVEFILTPENNDPELALIFAQRPGGKLVRLGEYSIRRP